MSSTVLFQSEKSEEIISRQKPMDTGTIDRLHTRVSASGFFEELIHYGQVMSGRAISGDEENTLLMEIEAQERLIKHQSAYGILDYEIDVLKSNLSHYRNQLGILRGRR